MLVHPCNIKNIVHFATLNWHLGGGHGVDTNMYMFVLLNINLFSHEVLYNIACWLDAWGLTLE